MEKEKREDGCLLNLLGFVFWAAVATGLFFLFCTGMAVAPVLTIFLTFIVSGIIKSINK